MKYVVELTGFDRAAAAVRKYPPRLLVELAKSVRWGQALLQRHVKQNYLSGQSLKRRTGRLSRSIHMAPLRVDGNSVIGDVGTNVEYARIHELGGQTKPHLIRPRNGKVLRWVDSGGFTFSARTGKMGRKDSGWLFATEVRHPGSNIPARPYLRPALADKEKEIVDHVRAAVARAWEEAAP